MSPAVPLLILCLACGAVGQLLFKRAANGSGGVDSPWHQRWRRFACAPWIWVGLGFFVVEFFLWLGVLSMLPLSRSVLLSSAGTLLMLAGGRVFFGERLGLRQILGSILIAVGVAVVGMN